MSNVQKMVKQVLALLPGVDCGGFGGCGYPTCKACAEAIADGAPITQCPACNNSQVAEIAKILGKKPVEVEEKIAFVRCAGTAAGKTRFTTMDSCQAAKDSGFLYGECQWGCMGVGSCIERCKFNAMTVEDGIVKIDKEKCNGCMACVSACPQLIIDIIPKDASNFIPCSSKADEKTTLATCGYGCIGCGDCAIACPEDAIEMVYDDKVDCRYASINYDKCVGCVACTVNCRKKIIVDELHDLTKVKEEVAFVKCVGGAKGNMKFKELGLEDCSDVEKLDLKSMNICEYGCTGLGNCTKVCRYDAITVGDGVAYIDYEKCVGCGDCMRACPRDVIVMAPYKGVKQVPCSSKESDEYRFRVCYLGCISCGDCADNCPNGAIEMVDGTPVINSELCENCGVCTYVCSRGLIAERKVPEYNYMQSDAAKIDVLKSDERKW